MYLAGCRVSTIGNDNNNKKRTAPERYLWLPLTVTTVCFRTAYQKSDVIMKIKLNQ